MNTDNVAPNKLGKNWLKDLRWEAPPGVVSVYDLHGKFLRYEPPTFYFDKLGFFAHPFWDLDGEKARKGGLK